MLGEKLDRVRAKSREYPGWFYGDSYASFKHLLVEQEVQGVTGDIMEIGCYHGQSASILAAALREEERLICNDLFEATTDDWRDGVRKIELQPPAVNQFLNNVANAVGKEVMPQLIIAKCSSLDVNTTRKFRFIHIDGCHTEEYATQDILFALGHMAPGCIIAIDDWRSWQWPGVGRAMMAMLQHCQGMELCHHDHHKAYLRYSPAPEPPYVMALTRRGGLPAMGRKSHKGAHRSGWPYCLDALEKYEDTEAETVIVLEDFAERTFCKIKNPRPWKTPWVGVFHHPPQMPSWFTQDTPPKLLATPAFQESLPTLRGCIALSEHLGRWLRRKLALPTLVVKHPTEFPEQTFDIDAYLTNEKRKMVQVGWYLRNMRGIYQLPPPPNTEKIHLNQDAPWIKKAMGRVDKHSPFKGRKQYPTTVLQRLPNAEYDALLAQSVVFLELFDSSANNAVVEAIARCTPIVVNRHPAVVEYLGADYPLFYDNIEDVADLVTDDSVVAAHEYIKTMDRTEFHVDYFVQAIRDFLRLLGPMF